MKQDAQIKPENEEFALGMAKRSNHATGKDARTGLTSEECAAEGCSNLSRGGGVCIRHGATIKLWSS